MLLPETAAAERQWMMEAVVTHEAWDQLSNPLVTRGTDRKKSRGEEG